MQRFGKSTLRSCTTGIMKAKIVQYELKVTKVAMSFSERRPRVPRARVVPRIVFVKFLT